MYEAIVQSQQLFYMVVVELSIFSLVLGIIIGIAMSSNKIPD